MIHVVYYESEYSYLSTGKNYQTENPLEAIEMWQKEFPQAIFAAAKYINP